MFKDAKDAYMSVYTPARSVRYLLVMLIMGVLYIAYRVSRSQIKAMIPSTFNAYYYTSDSL